MSKQANRPSLKQIMEQLANTFGMPGLKEWIQNIEDPLDYDDPNERQSVIRRNMEMLSQKLALLQQFSPTDPSQVKQYVENAGNFDYQEWQELERIKQDLNDYEHSADLETQSSALQSVIQAGREEVEKSSKKSKRKMGSYKGWIPS